ncbi:C-type mannose receptor 2-like [Ptychodera flava]|uniref:C-type mannose receptor 2-like n=1 Tax=Ptychodera flava TaxID=63121 RepID=UPI00396A3504
MWKVNVGVALIFISSVKVIDAQPTWSRECSSFGNHCYRPDICSYRLSFLRDGNAQCPALGDVVNQQERLKAIEQRLEEMTKHMNELQKQTPGRNVTRGCLSSWRYLNLNGRCYLVNTNNSFTWIEAYEFCYNAGSRLVLINSEDVNTFLQPFITGSSVWLGLHDLNSEDHWQWIDGTSVTYANWHEGEPNDDAGDEECAEIMEHPNAEWNDLPCTLHRGYICEYNAGCGTGWQNFKDKCYTIRLAEYVTWNEANFACEQLGSQLVTVHSEDINAFLVELTRNRGGPFWIGLNDAAADGKWRWTDGSMLAYSNWSPGHPSDTDGGGDCALFQEQLAYGKSVNVLSAIDSFVRKWLNTKKKNSAPSSERYEVVVYGGNFHM